MHLSRAIYCSNDFGVTHLKHGGTEIDIIKALACIVKKHRLLRNRKPKARTRQLWLQHQSQLEFVSSVGKKINYRMNKLHENKRKRKRDRERNNILPWDGDHLIEDLQGLQTPSLFSTTNQG